MPREPAFLLACDARPHAGPWLKNTIGVCNKPGGEETLEKLASRSAVKPIELTDDQLLALRDELTKVAPTKLEDLASRVGRHISVRGYETLGGGKRRDMMVKPGDSYLPAKIDGHGADGFPHAAREIPGLRWIHPSYAELLKTPRSSRKLSSRPLLQALGAHASPRIDPVHEGSWLHDQCAAPLRRPLPASQDRRLAELNRPGQWINGIRHDHDSKDLIAVVAYITRLRGSRRQGAARALVLSIDREWSKRYAAAASARAMHGYGHWYDRGPIPATWLARIQSTAFLTSESNRLREPVQLVLRTDAYVAVMGEDRASFCKEIREGDISTEVAEILGFAARPNASRIVKQLTELRSRDVARSISATAVSERTTVAYLALSAYCREARGGTTRLSGKDQIDDMRSDEMQAAFAHGNGLIYAGGRWLRPNEVFRGAPIFGDRRPFVSTDARDLWDTLRITEPSAAECIDVLKEIIDNPSAPSPQVLTDIYKRIEVDLLEGRRPRELKRLPLWTGAAWESSRPIYAIAQEGIARSLGRKLPVWQAPCALSSLPKFREATGVTLLDSQSFEPQGITPGHRGAGARTRPHFLAALRDFADLLSKQHPAVHSAALVSFDDVESYELAHSSKLEVLVRLTANDSRSAPVDVFASSVHRLIAFRDPEALGRLEVGGMAIAALFGEEWTTALAPLWEIAWTRADPENLREKVRLAREQPATTDPLKTLLETAAAGKAVKALVTGMSERDKHSATKSKSPVRPPKPVPRRRLRDLSNITFGDPAITGKEEPATREHRRKRRLRPPPTHPAPVPPKEPRGIREYDEKDKETAGFKLLAAALRSLDGSELADYRDLRNLGSDGIDNLKRFFELKAHEGDIPNEIALTASEIERALSARDRYFLAVVGGLETGEVVVRIFADPLATLDFVESGAVTLSGVHHKRSLLLRPAPPNPGAAG